MSFLGIEFAKASPNYRKKRFAAFVIDLAIVLILCAICYRIFGKPDFYAIKSAMDAAEGLEAEAQQEMMQQVFLQFDQAYRLGLLIWLGYEVLTTLALNGRTLGKLLLGLQIVPVRAERHPVVQYLLLVVRSLAKMISLYLFQSIPFIICALTVLTTKDRSGFDVFVRMKVAETR